MCYLCFSDGEAMKECRTMIRLTAHDHRAKSVTILESMPDAMKVTEKLNSVGIRVIAQRYNDGIWEYLGGHFGHRAQSRRVGEAGWR